MTISLGAGGSLQVGSTSDPKEGLPRHLEKTSPEEIPHLVEGVKRLRAKQYKSHSENSFESKVLRDNATSESKLVFIDRQIVQPGGGLLRVDLLCYDRSAERLVLAELKVHHNPEIRSKVFSQLEGYRRLFESHGDIAEDYAKVFEQQKELGLIPRNLPPLEVSRDPLLLLLMGGHPATPYKTSISKQAVKNALAKKRADFPNLPVHVHYWSDFQAESLLIERSVRELPLFEDWAEERLR